MSFLYYCARLVARVLVTVYEGQSYSVCTLGFSCVVLVLPLPCVILVLMHDDSLAFCVFPAFFLFSFVHLYAKFMRYCVHVCRSVFRAFSRLFRSGRAHVLSCSKQVLARAKSLIFTQCICVVFFPVRFAFLIKFCVYLKRVHLLASIFLRFYVVALVGVAPFFSRSPPIKPVA